MQPWRMKTLSFLRIKKYNLERQCEWNFPALWLFLEIVACHLNCLVAVVLAQSFFVLATFPDCFSVLDSWTDGTNMGTKWSSRIKKNGMPKKRYTHRIMIILCQGGFHKRNRKICKTITVYSRLLLTKIDGRVDFVPSVIQGLYMCSAA